MADSPSPLDYYADEYQYGALKKMLNRPLSAFEELLHSKSTSENEKLHRNPKILRYPYDLMMNPEHGMYMKIDIYEPDATALATRRKTFADEAMLNKKLEEFRRDILQKTDNETLKKLLGGRDYNRAADLTGLVNQLSELPPPVGDIAFPQYDIDVDSFVKAAGEIRKQQGLPANEKSETADKEKFDWGGIVQKGALAFAEALDVQATATKLAVMGGMRASKLVGPYFEQPMSSWVEEETGMPSQGQNRVGGVYLYMPTTIEASYGIEYESSNMAGMDMLQLPNALLSSDVSPDVTREIARKIGFANLKVLDKVAQFVPGFDGSFEKYMSAQTRQVTNPMSLHLFKEVKRREFTFPYVFLPRSREEVQHIHRIINTLKYYAHPQRSSSGRFLDYPAEFKITFMENDGTENFYLPIIQKCALSGIRVKYGDDATYSVFTRDISGSPPTKVTMELTFSELEILTRERFSSGMGIESPSLRSS